MESNSLKCPSIQMVRSIELKFRMYIIGHRPSYCVNFGEFRIISSFTSAQKRIFMHCNPLQPMESKYKKYASDETVLSIKVKFRRISKVVVHLCLPL